MVSKFKNTTDKYFKTTKQKGVFVIVVLLLIFVSFFTPVYKIEDIRVAGNNTVDSSTIIKASGIETGENIFKLDKVSAKKGIAKVAYINTVKIKRHFPHTVVIEVTESQECAYINFVGSFIGIDENGKALDVKQKIEDVTKPVIYGVSLSEFQIGSVVEFADNSKKQLLFDMLGQIKSSGIEEKIRYMDINDFDNITFTLNSKIAVKLGTTESIKYKIAYLKSVLDELGDTTGGVIDITDTENVVYTAN